MNASENSFKDSKNPFTSLKGHAAMEGLFQCEQGGKG